MSFQKYYEQLYSQTGIKAYIKKIIFNNLLKELVKQENEFEKQKEIIKKQAKALQEKDLMLKKQEKRINAIMNHITETFLLRDKPGLLIDVSRVSVTGNWVTGVSRANRTVWMTGLQRVINNLFHQIYNQSENVIPVQNKSGKFITSYKYLSRLEGAAEKAEQSIAFRQGDKILLLDDPWADFGEFSCILDLAADTGAKS